MKFPRVAFFDIDGKGYKSRTVFWNEQEEEEWLNKYSSAIDDILIVEATEQDIKDSQEPGEEFMPCEEEKFENYFLYLEVYERQIYHLNLIIHEALYEIRAGNLSKKEKKALLASPTKNLFLTALIDSLEVPCRSNLHKILMELYFDNDYKSDYQITEITEEDVKWLKIAFKYPKSYSTWRKILKGIKKGLPKEKVLEEELAKLRLRKAVENE